MPPCHNTELAIIGGAELAIIPNEEEEALVVEVAKEVELDQSRVGPKPLGAVAMEIMVEEGDQVARTEEDDYDGTSPHVSCWYSSVGRIQTIIPLNLSIFWLLLPYNS